MGLILTACTDPVLPKDARCGTYEVFENRAAKKGRKIPLKVVVLPALGPGRLPDPVVYFAGGPGGSSVEQGLFLSQFLAPLRQRRDILLVDARGTGGSRVLDCPELRPESVQAFLDRSTPPDKVRACRERLSKTADLTQYTTAEVVDDMDEVRAALGYPQLNVIGVSYGTRVELVYLRRHPDRVRTAILESVSTTHNRLPLFVPRNTQKALDGVVAECAGDADCARAFPHLQDELAAVLARAEREPAVRVQLTDSETAKPYELRLSRDIVLVTLRHMLYDPSSAAELPLQVHLAAQGNWQPLAQTASTVSAAPSPGFYLSVLCAEDVPFIRDQDIQAALAGTSTGDLRVRRFREACAEWRAAKLPESFEAPVVSDVPVLLINHERDPATPASDGEEAARTLRHSRSVLIPDGGHGMNGMKGQECVYGLWVKTIEDGSVDRLDTSCVAKMERPAFALNLVKPDPEVAVGRADLEPLAGSYASENGMAVKIDLLQEGRLRLKIESETYLLVPMAATRFRPEGLPPGYALRFERNGGGPATAAILIKPGQPEVRLTRRP